MGDMANNVGFCLNRAKLFLIIRKDYLTMTPKFDGYAAQYDAWFMENENLFHSELRLFQKVLGDIAGKRVLSVGCGSGLFESMIDCSGIEGIEPSRDMGAIAQ